MKRLNNHMKTIGMLLLMLWALQLQAQSDWEVDANAFQYTMTVTGSGHFQCESSTDTQNEVAAFINGEVRGVARFETQANGQWLAYLTVYDHQPAGSAVSFKLRHAATDEISDAVMGVSFSDGGIHGNAGSPFEFRDAWEIKEILMPADSLLEDFSAGTVVSELFLLNENEEVIAGNFSFVNDELGPDNGHFDIAGPLLILESEIDFEALPSYQVHLQGSTDEGCATTAVFVLAVINNNAAPQGLVTDTMQVAENEPSGTLVGVLEAIDDTPDDAHSFELFDAEDVYADNAYFYITGNELYSAASFDYEEKNSYLLQMRITDRAGNEALAELHVLIMDVIEAGNLGASNLVTPNNDGYNDKFHIPNVHLYADYQLTIFNAIGNRVFEAMPYDNSWTGEQRAGRALPSGTYYYSLQHRSDADKRFEGQIHLYRENKF